MSDRILTLVIRHERDIVLARQRARQISALLGFDAQDQIRIATGVSEIARNAYSYAHGGVVEFLLHGSTAPQVLHIRISDGGPGIVDLTSILEGRYRSQTGMGMGIIGTRRLMDQFEIESDPQHGTIVTLKKLLPLHVPVVSDARIARIGDELSGLQPQDTFQEVERQNQELLSALSMLTKKQDELIALNQELQDTNRGVMALYAELDEKADHLRRADELKSRFLSNMTHEFRTPVNSIQALCRMMLDRTDGDLNSEQERQVVFIRKAAEALSELVNDLLDLAKVEAGKSVVRPTEFEVADLFGALRGMLRPLLINDSINLIFEDAAELPPLMTDEGKVSQIVRNFISNALKYTERGEVRVSAKLSTAQRGFIELAVSDTGIGIAGEHIDTIFQEFTQIDSPVQRRVRGTGLGLPLCKRLAQLLGGDVTVESTLGRGSVFTAVLPISYPTSSVATREWALDERRMPLLVIEDTPEDVVAFQKYLSGSQFQVLVANNLREARDAIATFRPVVITLDIRLSGEDSWQFLAELKRNPATRSIPVAVFSSVDDAAKGFALGADAYCIKPIDRGLLLQTLYDLTSTGDERKVLIIDDEEISRYLLRQQLLAPGLRVSEAATGREGLAIAQQSVPDLICLDLVMPDIDGFEVLSRLKSDSATRHIPVLIFTSKVLRDSEREWLERETVGIRSKASMPDSALAAVEQALMVSGRN